MVGHAGRELSHRAERLGLDEPALGLLETVEGPAQARDQLGVLERHGGVGAERVEPGFVVLAEAAGLLGEIEGAEGLPLEADGNREEGAHGGMPRGEADGVGMGGEIVQPERARAREDVTQEAAALRRRTDPRARLRVEAVGEELAEGAVLLEQRERRVARPGEAPRRLHEPLEEARDLALPRDGPRRLVE